MEQIKHYVLPENTNRLYKEEAISSIGLSREIANKINELIDAYNSFSEEDLRWKQTQEGIIRKGIVYMKDNLVNSIYEMMKSYDNDTIKRIMLEAYGAELEAYGAELENLGVELAKIKVIVTPQMFGAKGDGVTNDIEAIENAIGALNEGDVLYFPRGTYLMIGREVSITKPNITFKGEGLIRCDYGFRPKASHFKAIGLQIECTSYSIDNRAFMIDKSVNDGETPEYVEGFTFKDCSFKNFFYSICAIGGAYTFDGTEETRGYPVRDVVIENCYSSTYEDNNAGHFQMIQIENISYINNRTYGGQNASSYNAIKGNGFIRVIGNYDHNNSYASCEIENGSGRVVIANNTFNSKIWIDDSFDVVVNANTTEEGIQITVGSNNGDANNVIISNNTCRNIRCEQFGTYSGGVINNINIIGNNVRGDNTHGIWIHGNAVKNAKVCNNFISGTNTNDISIQRNEQLTCYISGNFGNGKFLLIAGTSGTVYAIDNYNFSVSGNRDSITTSHLERSFNGLKVSDSSGAEWRINVDTTGAVKTVKY